MRVAGLRVSLATLSVVLLCCFSLSTAAEAPRDDIRDVPALVEQISLALDADSEFTRNPRSPEAQAALADALAKAVEDSGKAVSAEHVDMITSVIVELDMLWRVNRDPTDEKSFWHTVRHLAYYYLTPVELTEEERERLDAQKQALLAYARNFPHRFAEAVGMSQEEAQAARQTFSPALSDLERFLQSPFYRFTQVPLSQEGFDALMAEMEQYVQDALPKLSAEWREAQEDPAAQMLAKKGRSRAADEQRRQRRSEAVVFSASVYLCSTAAVKLVRAHMNKILAAMTRALQTPQPETVAGRERYFPFGIMGFGVLYRGAAVGKGMDFHIFHPDRHQRTEEP